MSFEQSNRWQLLNGLFKLAEHYQLGDCARITDIARPSRIKFWEAKEHKKVMDNLIAKDFVEQQFQEFLLPAFKDENGKVRLVMKTSKEVKQLGFQFKRNKDKVEIIRLSTNTSILLNDESYTIDAKRVMRLFY